MNPHRHSHVAVTGTARWERGYTWNQSSPRRGGRLPATSAPEPDYDPCVNRPNTRLTM